MAKPYLDKKQLYYLGFVIYTIGSCHLPSAKSMLGKYQLSPVYINIFINGGIVCQTKN